MTVTVSVMVSVPGAAQVKRPVGEFGALNEPLVAVQA